MSFRLASIYRQLEKSPRLHLQCQSRLLFVLLNPEDEDIMMFRNVRTVYQLTWSNNPQHLNLQQHRCQNIKPSQRTNHTDSFCKGFQIMYLQQKRNLNDKRHAAPILPPPWRNSP